MGIFTNNAKIVELGALILAIDAFIEPGRTFNLVVLNGLRGASNVAKVLKLWPTKGTITIGSDADIIVINKDFKLTNVWAKGQHMVKDSKAIVWGTFEAKPIKS